MEVARTFLSGLGFDPQTGMPVSPSKSEAVKGDKCLCLDAQSCPRRHLYHSPYRRGDVRVALPRQRPQPPKRSIVGCWNCRLSKKWGKSSSSEDAAKLGLYESFVSGFPFADADAEE